MKEPKIFERTASFATAHDFEGLDTMIYKYLSEARNQRLFHEELDHSELSDQKVADLEASMSDSDYGKDYGVPFMTFVKRSSTQ